ncbi:MAG: phosphatase PAP2 family protein [Candidatus Limivivens sp.]|nr:phosphatase PAP2 family protein [Candidatus Limivivens sp.]
MEWLKKKAGSVVPVQSLIPLLSCFFLNDLVYFVFRMFVRDAYHYDFTTPLDRMVPFQPAWVSIYLVCYLFWVVNYLMVGRLEKEHFYRFVTADLLSRLVCGLFYLFLPTTNVRPEVTGTGIWELLMAWLYAADEPTNLFPSIHCLTSWFCYIGIRGQKKIPRWYQGFSLIFAILVCLSTQFTKQHYLVDLIGGVALAEGSWRLCSSPGLYRPVMNFFERVNQKVFGKRE